MPRRNHDDNWHGGDGTARRRRRRRSDAADDATPVDLSHATVVGLARVIANEMPDRLGRRYWWWSLIHLIVMIGGGVGSLILFGIK